MKSADILAEVATIFGSAWKRSPGIKVPDIERLALRGNHGIELEGTVLYADMADSTKLVETYKDEFAAEIYRAYLLAACRIINDEGGSITAFDGDRVMAVYVGDRKNTQAVTSALKINFIVKEINKAIRSQYPSTSFTLAQCVGVDTSKLLVTKTGIRDSNDLVWVGTAANHAAKLSSLNEPGFPSFITEAVYKKLADTAKFGGNPKIDMWEKRTWTATGRSVYRSSFWWGF
jgi:class 3 adenylate cyclase